MHFYKEDLAASIRAKKFSNTNKERRFCEKLGTNILNLMKKHCEVDKSFKEETLREKMQIF